MDILNSATKITLLILVLALIGLTFLKIVASDQFMNVVIAVVSFYFGQKQNPPPEVPPVLS